MGISSGIFVSALVSISVCWVMGILVGIVDGCFVNFWWESLLGPIGKNW